MRSSSAELTTALRVATLCPVWSDVALGLMAEHCPGEQARQRIVQPVAPLLPPGEEQVMRPAPAATALRLQPIAESVLQL